ncbi:UNKNOWN [Stylonychia lemnae]|uniref:Tpr domain containing protein n=1 Tax=Stylonychia lemnae TaxID=5949 RepID=A0A078B2W5_STYLE|nr:UNKNOWN [Stylonychia lemnae]|eukprot:CDW88809.1 UNKNOWN [Stylonychia lemnae]
MRKQTSKAPQPSSRQNSSSHKRSSSNPQNNPNERSSNINIKNQREEAKEQQNERNKAGQNEEEKQNSIPNFTPSSNKHNPQNDPPKVIKGILKKPKADGDVNSTSMINQSQIGQTPTNSNSLANQNFSRQIQNQNDTPKNRNISQSTPLTIVSAYHSFNQQNLATQTVDAAFEEYLKVQEELASRGEIEESLKNLQEGLNERLSLYPARDRGVWLISKLIAEIGIRLAVRCLNNEKMEKANQYLKLARKHTEPLPNSDWSDNAEWMGTRKNVFKNLALKEDWSKAFDCFKVALKLEKDLRENSSNTALTCAVILSKLNRYAESIDYAQNCMNTIEAHMNMDRNKPLAEYKFFGTDPVKILEFDKIMTSYAISLHLLGNNLANLKYIKEAKVFLTKAQYVTNNMLNKPKPDLQLAITNDLNNLQKNYKTQINLTKKTQMEDIESSLMNIKTNLANNSYSQLVDQQEQKALYGTISNGPPIKMLKKEETKKKKKGQDDEHKEEELKEEEDDDKNVFNFVKRFAEEKKKKENEALDEYHKRIKLDYDDKQKEFIERQQKTKFTKEIDKNMQLPASKPQFTVTGQFKPTDKKAIAPSQKSAQQIKDEARAARLRGPKPKEEVKTDDEKSSRVKKPPINPAAEGAKLDRKGVKYSSDKERVNEKLGFGPSQEENQSDEDMTEWQGGHTKQDDINKFDLHLPPIAKGYKLDDLGLTNAGERALSKYEGGYTSDQSAKSKQMFNTQDPGTRRLLQTLEGKYKKAKPSSMKNYDEDQKEEESADEFQRAPQKQEDVINPFRTISGDIKDIPQYKPPQIKINDWRNKSNRSSSDDELPDTNAVLKKLNLSNPINNEDPSKKLSIVQGDETRYEENPPILDASTIDNANTQTKTNTFQIKNEDQKEDLNKSKNLRVTILNKPPRAINSQVKRKEDSKTDLNKTHASTETGQIKKQLQLDTPATIKHKQESSSSLHINLGVSQNDTPVSGNRQGRGEDSDEKRQKRIQSQERLLQLSQPKPKQYVLVKEDEEEDDETQAKLKQLQEKTQKGKSINFSDYVDRDVPYIKNNLGIKGNDSMKNKTKEFDTKFNNKSGLFSKIGQTTKNKDTPAGDVKYIKDKKVSKTPKSPLKGHLNDNSFDDDMQDYIKRQSDEEGGPAGKSGFARLFNKKQNAKKGLKGQKGRQGQRGNANGGYELKGANLTFNDLRQLEREAATYIEKMARGYFIRKWYSNYQIRRRLGIPFSGLEFTENAFLRYFQKPNQSLHDLALVPPQLVEVVQQQAKYRNMIVKQVKHGQNGKKKKRVDFEEEEAKLEASQLKYSDEEIIQDPDMDKKQQPKRVPRRIPKNQTPVELLGNLQKDFVAKGLDAYTQFKKYGGGIDHDDNGKVVTNNQAVLARDPKDMEEIENMENKVPKWTDQNNDFIEVKEHEGYLHKIGKVKAARKEAEQQQQLALMTQAEMAAKGITKQNFVSSLATFAQVHGVFNKPEPGQGSKSGEQSKRNDGNEDDDIQALLKKRRMIDEDEDYFPVEKYQEFSREAVVFYKRIGDMMVRWTIQVGSAFKKDRKFYIPVKLIGEQLKSRSTIAVYLMNLEMLKISKDIDKNFEFETIWPFILYLFNNWVRHQVRMMGLVDQRPDLKNAFVQSENNMYDVQEFDDQLKNVKQEYDEMLNFSSEIEYDDRFDFDKYISENKPEHLLDRSRPRETRMKPIEQMKTNKDKLFQAYKLKINMYEQLMQKVDEEKDYLMIDENGKPIKKVRILTDDLFEPVTTRKQNPFEFFLRMHFVPLPKTDLGQYKLIQNLQALNYSEKLKRNGLVEDNIAIMNEERRKRRGLPPLQIIDYNCIDRAALKLKIIVECLFLRRQMNGWCLVPRDVKESLLAREWSLRRQKNEKIACQREQISSKLIKIFGLSITYPNQFNEKAIQIQQSMQRMQDFRNKRIMSQDHYEYLDPQALDDEMLRQTTGNDQNPMISNRTNINPMNTLGVNSIMIRSGHLNSNHIITNEVTQIKEVNENENEDDQNADINQDAIGKLMDLSKIKQDIEDFVREQEILEQGVLKIENNYYIMTMYFRRIASNYENMRAIIDERVKRFSNDDDEVDLKEERMKSRQCEFVSEHPYVMQYDLENHNEIKEMERIDIEQEKFTKRKTGYRSYTEIKVCSKISTTNWDDSFNLSWEQLQQFFMKFGFKWSPHNFLNTKRFNQKERFTFFNFFAECLFIYDCRVQLDMQRLDIEQYKFEKIFLNLEQIQRTKRQNKLQFYFDDYLEDEFDETKYDYAIYPFYEDPRLTNEELVKDQATAYFNYNPVYEDKLAQSVTIQIVEGNKKPELLIDENAREYLEDPNNLFNLTLSTYPQSDDIYLGKIKLSGKEGYKNQYNLRIDYYVLGYVPTLLIKIFNTIYYEIFELKVTNKKIIKDVIRICKQQNDSMVINQLQSMLQINSKLNGSYLKLNFNIRRDRNVNLGQNYLNMLICNENLLRQMQKDNYRQFQGIVYFENLGGRMLVTVTEFIIDVEQISTANSEQQINHGNKHIPLESKASNARIGGTTKRFQRVRLWKINVFNIFNSKNYEAVVSYEDLINYYESEIFKFYQDHPNMIKPNLVHLLQDYIRNLFVFRSKVGQLLYWKLPQFSRPLDKNGQVVPVSSDQIYKLKLLDIYHKLQKKIDEQNRDDDNNALPFSLDQMKAKKHYREPPSLSLRNKLILEKELPIFSPNDSRLLKLTSSNQEVIVQMSKVFKSLLRVTYCVVTVVLYPAMECWIWQIYFLKTQRTFSVTFYPSDLFNMDHEILNNQDLGQAKSPAIGLWSELIKRSDLHTNNKGDIILVCETYREPLKEVLFQDHVFNENASDIFFLEVTLKSHENFVTDVRDPFYPLEVIDEYLSEFTIGIRAFSLTRNIWIKDYQPLTEVVRILRREKYLSSDTRLIYYSMLRDAATLISHKIVFSDEAKNIEVKRQKLTYDIRNLLNQKEQFSKLQEEQRNEHMPDNRLKEDRRQRKDHPPLRNKLDDTVDQIQKDHGLRNEWKNQIELNKIIFQGVISQNPIQVCTVIYNEVKDLFIYRLYRVSDCNVYEKRINSIEIEKTCAPNYQKMLQNRMQGQLGERICEFYKTQMIVSSLMKYYNLKK